MNDLAGEFVGRREEALDAQSVPWKMAGENRNKGAKEMSSEFHDERYSPDPTDRPTAVTSSNATARVSTTLMDSFKNAERGQTLFKGRKGEIQFNILFPSKPFIEEQFSGLEQEKRQCFAL
ncbi:unnamed protein product [Linum tenue]|nr:unnamed protein product [Linum tenue]